MSLPSVEALEQLAWKADQQLRLHGVRAAIHFLYAFLVPARRNHQEPLCTAGGVKKLLHLFRGVCETLNLYSPFVSSFCLKKLEVFKSTPADLNFCNALECLSAKSARKFFEFFLNDGLMIFALVMVQSRPKEKEFFTMETVVARFYDETSLLLPTTLKLFAKAHFKKSTFCELLIQSIKNGDIVLFEFTMNGIFDYELKCSKISLTDVMDIRPSDDNESTHASVMNLIVKGTADAQHNAKCKHLKHMLEFVVKTGFSTFHANTTNKLSLKNTKSALEIGASAGNIDIVRLLYRTGATTNAELRHVQGVLKYKCWQDPSLLKDDTMQQINRYVFRASRHPRRLQDLCLLTVSHCVGCRGCPERVQAMANLVCLVKMHIQHATDKTKKFSLSDRLLLYDALIDFEAGTSFQAKERDPPGV